MRAALGLPPGPQMVPKANYLEEPPHEGLTGWPWEETKAETLRLAKQAASLKAGHPGAWAAGLESAADALASRPPDLIRKIHERGDEGINAYVRAASEAAVQYASAGDIEIHEPRTNEALTALGISFGMALRDALDRESQGG